MKKGWFLTVLMGLVALVLVHSDPAVVTADARSDYLVRLLENSSTFRVRAQAALSMGGLDRDPDILSALTAALNDDHPAVRTAVASALGRYGDTEAVPALQRRIRRERNRAAKRAMQEAVRTIEASGGGEGGGGSPTADPPRVDNARFYVAVGRPGTKVRAIARPRLVAMRSFLAEQIGDIDGVQLAPDDESNSAARRTTRRRRMTGFFIDSSIVSIEDRGDGVRASVSLIVNTYPGRDMRAILQGAATVQGASGEEAERSAIEHAFRGALRRLQQAMEQSRR